MYAITGPSNHCKLQMKRISSIKGIFLPRREIKLRDKKLVRKTAVNTDNDAPNTKYKTPIRREQNKIRRVFNLDCEYGGIYWLIELNIFCSKPISKFNSFKKLDLADSDKKEKLLSISLILSTMDFVSRLVKNVQLYFFRYFL
jgi:hypothetical protein